ncbi:MAG: ATP-dependent Clp protease adaptor ClpS [Fimbriimonadaceae bacterium]
MVETAPLSAEQLITSLGDGAYFVVIFNNPFTLFDQVVEAIVKYTCCSFDRALELTMQAHKHGSAIIFYGSLSGCEAVAKGMGAIGVKTEVRSDCAE